MDNGSGDRLLKVAEVAERLGLSRAGVYELFEANRLRTVRPSALGKSVRVRATDLDAFIESLSDPYPVAAGR